MQKILLSFAAWLLALTLTQAQVISWEPFFPTLDDSLTITYDATQGNRALIGVTPVYGHFGLVVAGPNSTAWTRVVGNFNMADPRVAMTQVSPNIWKIRFLPRSFFSAPSTLVAYRIGMVFRNTNGTTVGRSSTGTDIFMPLFQPGEQAVRIVSPVERNTTIVAGQAVAITARTSEVASIEIAANGTPIQSTVSDSTLSALFGSTQGGTYQIIARAGFASGAVKYDTINVIVRGNPIVAPVPAGWHDGVNYLSPTSVGLVFAAPQKHYVYVRGDFNNWNFDTAYFMRHTPDSSRFWVQINNLTPGNSYVYQYAIDGALQVADPLAEMTSDPNDNQISTQIYPDIPAYRTGLANGVASVLRPGRTPYAFTHPKPTANNNKLVVYELLLRDFLGRGQDKSFQGLTDTLNYLSRLGISAVELMPVNEFEGNQSWGYNVSFHGAVDKSYGPSDKLKVLIDSLHGRGIAVILDVVYNHAFSQNPYVQMYWDGSAPLANSPYFNRVATHPFNVGFDFNHRSVYTQAYIDECNRRWLQDFNVDGFRFDLSKGFTQTNSGTNVGTWGNLDTTRINNIKRIGQVCRRYNPNAYLILEHFADNSEEIRLSALGFMPWGNLNYAYAQNTMGYLDQSQLNGGYYAARGWQAPNLVTYEESHDEERILYKNLLYGRIAGDYNTKDLATKINRACAAACIFLPIPGPKMIWQFGELGYDISINQCPNGTINTNGNCKTDPKPVRWDFYTDEVRQRLFKTYQAVLRLKTTEPAFYSPTAVQVNLSGSLAGKQITLSYPNSDVVIMANMDVTPYTATRTFTAAGRWYEFFSGDSVDLNGTTQDVTLFAGEARIYSQKRFFRPAPNLINAVAPSLSADKSQPEAWPNPANGTCHLRFAAGAKLPAPVYATDALGRTIQLKATREDATTVRLATGALAPGLYTLSAPGMRTVRVAVE